MSETSHDSETPTPSQQVITVCALIHHNFNGIEKVFLPRRAATKKFLPSVFELPGGHVDFGENLVDALKREIREEFDKDIKVGQVLTAFDYLNPIKQSHSVEIIYLAEFVDGVDDIKLDPADHSEYVWLAEDETSKIFTKMKDENDDEIIAIHQGFEILKKGAPCNGC
jgi:ADP-ribose pyrophosphatase YjhB (NUDIX family)